MVTDKLAKEFEKIRASLGKSKKLILADIDKIDEKYRKLAQEEKKNLTESLGVLNDQLKYYDMMLGVSVSKDDASDEFVEPDYTEEPPVLDEEPAIVDTIFPDNLDNVSSSDEDKKEETFVESASVEPATVIEDIPEVKEEKEKVVVNAEWPDNDNLKIGEDGWPEWPEA
jgi:hypothetical protein